MPSRSVEGTPFYPPFDLRFTNLNQSLPLLTIQALQVQITANWSGLNANSTSRNQRTGTFGPLIKSPPKHYLRALSRTNQQQERMIYDGSIRH